MTEAFFPTLTREDPRHYTLGRFRRNIRHTNQMWRRRVGVEPTIRSAKGRIGGFEGRDSHRTIFASAWIIDHHDWASDELANLLLDRRANCSYFLPSIRKTGTTFSRRKAQIRSLRGE